MRRSFMVTVAVGSLFVAPGLALGAEKLPGLGEAAPQFQLRTITGEMVRLDELAYKGKEKSYAKKRPVLMDFFRTDCAPCRKEMAEVKKLHQTRGPQGLEVVIIALLEEEDGRGKLERYIEAEKIPFRVIVDDSEHVAKRYLGKELVLPNMFLLDREGVIRARVMQLQEDLEKALGDALPKVLEKT